MSGSLGMMGPRILDIRKFRTCGGGVLISVLWSRQLSCQDAGVGVHCRMQQKVQFLLKRFMCCSTATCGAVCAGLGDGLFIFVQVALSTCIMQASEKILFALYS